MKKLLFYPVLLFQIIVLLFLMFQFEYGRTNSETLQLKTALPDYYMDDMYNHVMEGEVYVDFEINKIIPSNWDSEQSPEYNHRVYILLEENDAGIFEVVAGADYPLKADANQIVLSAFYHYYDTEYNLHFVRYGFEAINDIDKFGSFQRDDRLLVTVQIGKWGQREVTHVEKIE